MSKEEQHVRNHDSSGKPDREETQHTVQEDCHLKYRDKEDKFDLVTDEGNIDFNISGISDEAVKRSDPSINSENHTSPTTTSCSG